MRHFSQKDKIHLSALLGPCDFCEHPSTPHNIISKHSSVLMHDECYNLYCLALRRVAKDRIILDKEHNYGEGIQAQKVSPAQGLPHSNRSRTFLRGSEGFRQASAQGDVPAEVTCHHPDNDDEQELAFPDANDAKEANRSVLEEMPGTGSHSLWSPEMLDSALHRPQMKAAYDDDADIFDIAAALAHAIVQNHAFENGNHRTAHIVTQKFLSRNGYGHITDYGDDDEFAQHIQGNTQHGQAKSENGRAFTEEETAEMFRKRHEDHLRNVHGKRQSMIHTIEPNSLNNFDEEESLSKNSSITFEAEKI